MGDKKSSITEQYYTPPPKLSGWESFKIFMWNGETSEFLGRTASSWGKLTITLFFLFHYFPSKMYKVLFLFDGFCPVHFPFFRISYLSPNIFFFSFNSFHFIVLLSHCIGIAHTHAHIIFARVMS